MSESLPKVIDKTFQCMKKEPIIQDKIEKK